MWGSSFKMNGLKVPMGRRSKSLLLCSAFAAMAIQPALAQVRPAATAAKVPAAAAKPSAAAKAAVGATKAAPITPQGAVPGNPDYKADQPQVPPAAVIPAPLPPAIWDAVSAQDLLHYIQQIGQEGLDLADYDPAGLAAAIASGDPAAASKALR